MWKFVRSQARTYIVRSLTLCCLGALAACGGGGGGSSSAAPTANAPPATPPPSTPPPSTPPATPPPTTTVLKLLALVSEGVQQQFADPDLRVVHMVSVANDVLADSGVDVEIELVHVEMVSYPDTAGATQALDDVTFARHSAFANTATLRNDVEADLVALIRPYANDGLCGYAWIGGYGTSGDFGNPVEADYAYSVVAANCSDYTLLHELGHNLGLAHSVREDVDGGTHSWAVGHGVDNDFVTIMASPTEFNAARLPRLSSPGLTCNGQPCGVPWDQPDGADAVRTLNQTAEQVAGYR